MDITGVRYVFVVLLLMETDIRSHYIEERGYKLVFHQEQLGVLEASSVCKSHGGSLLVIKDFAVQEILADIPSLRNVSVWVGLSYSNNSWSWSDGSALDSQWETVVGTTGCVSVTLDTDGVFMESRSCSVKLPYFCQYRTGSCFFRVYQYSSIVGHNVFQLTDTSLDTCKTICGHMTEFQCASFEYSEVNQFCQMNDVNRWSASESFVFKIDRSWDYYHKTCYSSTLLTEDSDQYTMSTDYLYFTPVMSTTLPPVTVETATEPLSPLSTAKRFVLSNKSLTWDDATRYCEAEKGSLAKIDDPSIVPEIGYKSIVDPYLYGTDLHCRNELFWFGLRGTGSGEWNWFDGSLLKWSNFKYKPNMFDLIFSCGAVSLVSEWWYTGVCNEKKRFVCQFMEGNCNFNAIGNATLIAHNAVILNGVTRNECEDYCTHNYSPCRSYEYNSVSQTCQISDQNKWTIPQYFYPKSTNWTYYHRRCNFGYDSVKEETTPFVTTTGYDSVNDETTFIATTTERIQTSTDLLTTELLTTENVVASPGKLIKDIVIELQELGKELKRKRAMREKTSAVDNRPSAKGVGIAASIILISIFGSIVILDLSTMGAQCNQFSVKQRRKSSKYKTRNIHLKTSTNNTNSLPGECNETMNRSFFDIRSSNSIESFNDMNENNEIACDQSTKIVNIKTGIHDKEGLKDNAQIECTPSNTQVTNDVNKDDKRDSYVTDDVDQSVTLQPLQSEMDASRERGTTNSCLHKLNSRYLHNTKKFENNDNCMENISSVQIIHDSYECDHTGAFYANEDKNRCENENKIDMTYL